MKLLFMFILWTWGLTPLWVNIVGTCVLGLGILAELMTTLIDHVRD